MTPPRRLVADDITWMATLARRRFGEYNEISAGEWIVNRVLPDSRLYLPIRTNDAFLIAGLNSMPWNLVESVAIVLLLVTDENAVWQGVQLLRASIEWAKVRKAASWRYNWDNSDAGILARRVGATLEPPRYKVILWPPD